MNIEVLLIENMDDVNAELINNYEVNKNLFQVNKFKAKKDVNIIMKIRKY